MKMNVKIILPLLIISALLILLAGCMTTPSDESPGVTPGTGTIMGTIAAPCCTLSDELVTETPCVYSEYWCCYCETNWFEQDGIEVVLTYGENEVATTTTNADGEYIFNDIPQGKNYVITAYCPDYNDNRPLVKDVALQVLEGKTFDTKITDCVSTSMGLVVDFLVENTTVLGPEEIVLDGVVAGMPNFYGFPAFKKLVERICEISAECVNLFEDEKVPDYLCKAAEEVGRKVIPDLELGCTPGFTGGGDDDDDEEDPCEGNAPPVITDPSEGLSVLADEGEKFSYAVKANDDPTQTLTFTLDQGSLDRGMTIGANNGIIAWLIPICDCLDERLANDNNIAPSICSYPVTVTVKDSCDFTDTVAFNVKVTCNLCVDRLEVDPGSMELCYDSSGSFTLNAIYDDATVKSLLGDATVVYSGYDTSIITVDNTGTITADKCGTTTIDISYTDPVCGGAPQTASIDVEVKGALVGLKVTNDPDPMVLCADDTGSFTLEAIYNCGGLISGLVSLLGNDAVVYTYDTSIITVDNTGTITADKCGETTIDIEYTDAVCGGNPQTASIDVEVLSSDTSLDYIALTGWYNTTCSSCGCSGGVSETKTFDPVDATQSWDISYSTDSVNFVAVSVDPDSKIRYQYRCKSYCGDFSSWSSWSTPQSVGTLNSGCIVTDMKRECQIKIEVEAPCGNTNVYLVRLI